MHRNSLGISHYESDPYLWQRKRLLLYGQYEWPTIYEDYMPDGILGFTTLNKDIHLPRTPRHHAHNVIPHKKGTTLRRIIPML